MRVDLMHHNGEHHLVAIDYFSGYIFTDRITSETAETITDTLNQVFKRLGLVESIITDNGPCFKSDKFKQFCEILEINHVTSSPHYHQSNGRVKRAI